jgi:hypothetical protein
MWIVHVLALRRLRSRKLCLDQTMEEPPSWHCCELKDFVATTKCDTTLFDGSGNTSFLFHVEPIEHPALIPRRYVT